MLRVRANSSTRKVSYRKKGLQAISRTLVSDAIFFCPQLPIRSLSVPVTHDPSRKEFFAKLGGLAAALTILPRFLTRARREKPATPQDLECSSFTFSRDVRTVARRDLRG